MTATTITYPPCRPRFPLWDLATGLYLLGLALAFGAAFLILVSIFSATTNRETFCFLVLMCGGFSCFAWFIRCAVHEFAQVVRERMGI